MSAKALYRALVALLLIGCIEFNAVAAPSIPEYSGVQAMMNNIIRSTPGLNGVSVTGVADGVALRTTGNITATATSGLRIPVMATSEALITKAALASAAAKLVAGANVVGAAYTGYEVYKWVKDSGITTCPPPAFFCKPSTQPATANGYFWSSNYPAQATEMAACQDWANVTAHTGQTLTIVDVGGGNRFCDVNNGYYSTRQQVFPGTTSCPSGFTMSGTTCTNPNGGAAYTPDELASGLIGQGGNWDPARSKTLMDAITADRVRQPGVLTDEDVKPSASAANVSAPAVTTPGQITKVETVTNPDGTTSTKTTTETTTVTPTSTGPGTLANPPKLALPTTTTSTVTTVNNSTNSTTTNTTTTNNNGSPQDEKPALCKLFPTVLACQEMGQAPDAEKVTPVDMTPTLTALTFASAASCPTPITYNLGKYGTKNLEFTALCDWLTMCRPIMLAVGACAVAFIFMRGVQST